MLGHLVGGKYELRRLLGGGATGSVYEGVHLELGKRLAIKVARPELSGSPELERRFRREARAASAIESDYVVQIVDFGRDERHGLYLVLEYLEGEDLGTRLARERWITEREAAAIGVQVGRGLTRAHSAGIVHGGLRPAKVFLVSQDDGSRVAKLLDFGISRVECAPSSRSGPASTTPGAPGHPRYMSPEQCAGAEAIDGRADVWALAAILYEMIAGEPAVVDGGSDLATRQSVMNEDVAALGRRASWVGERFAAVVDAGLARDPDLRIPDAATLVARILDAVPGALARPALDASQRATDISELGPPESESARSTTDPAPPGPASGSLEESLGIFVRDAEVPRALGDRRHRSGAGE